MAQGPTGPPLGDGAGAKMTTGERTNYRLGPLGCGYCLFGLHSLPESSILRPLEPGSGLAGHRESGSLPCARSGQLQHLLPVFPSESQLRQISTAGGASKEQGARSLAGPDQRPKGLGPPVR